MLHGARTVRLRLPDQSLSMTTPLDQLPSLAPVWIVAFTGHRPGDGPGRSRDEIDACRNTLRETFESLRRQAAAAGGTIELLCSAAEGADLLAVDVAAELDLPVHLLLPLSEESFRADFEGAPPSVWSAVQRHLERARDPRSLWTLRTASARSPRPGCYHDANLQILEAADVLVAIFNGRPSASVGGTAEMIAMADEHDPPVATIVLDPARGGEVVRQDTWTPRGPAETRLDELNRDMAGEWARSSRPAEQRDGPDAIWAVHKALDNVANNSSAGFRASLVWSIWLHFGATVLAAGTAAFGKVLTGELAVVPKVLTAVELLLVAWATFMTWTVQLAHTNATWRRTRFGAELADSLIRSAGLVDPLSPPVVRHDETWKRFALAIALAAHRQKLFALASLDPPQRFEELKTAYHGNRIAWQRDRYFGTQQHRSAIRYRRWSALARWASTTAVVVVALALLLKLASPAAGKDPGSAFLVLFLPILLPLLASLASSMIVARDAARRASRHSQILRRLRKLERLTPFVRTEAAMQRVVAETEDLLLGEIVEWHATAESIAH